MNQNNKTNRKHGFTLAELLIVVAIIAVLVAIGIPILNKTLEKSREAHDIYTMRVVASAAVDLYYAGINNEASAKANGLKWWQNDGKDQANAAGVYNPKTGKFLAVKSDESKLAYGKGTKVDGGTSFSMGNEEGAYSTTEDYTKAVVMVSIYPLGNNKHIDVYWKYSSGDNKGKYVGGYEGNQNNPKYSIRISLE